MPDQLHFTFPAQVVPNGDGSYTVRPGRPIAEEWITLAQFAERIGRPVKSLYLYVPQMIDAQVARRNGPKLYQVKVTEALHWWNNRWEG